MGAPLGLIFCKRALVRGHLLEPRATAAQHGRSRMAAWARAADDDATRIVAVMLEGIDAPEHSEPLLARLIYFILTSLIGCFEPSDGH